jgi:hypothetical protein
MVDYTTVGFAISSVNAGPTERLKSGAGWLFCVANPGRAEIFAPPYPFDLIALYAFMVSMIAFSTGSRSMLEAP